MPAQLPAVAELFAAIFALVGDFLVWIEQGQALLLELFGDVDIDL
jgi:hypothetical protein